MTMTKTVILAEKPDQGKAYANALGKVKDCRTYMEVETDFFPGEVIVTWGIGHLVSMAPMDQYDEKYKAWNMADLPFLPKDYLFTVTERTKAQFSAVKKQLQTADLIIIGTDADREGENIAYSIINKCGQQVQRIPKKRLWVSSMVKSEIQKAFKNLRESNETYNYYIEAQTRQISDYLVGMNFTRYFTLRAKESGLDGVWSIGRVQTPCNSLVVQNDLAISQFKPENFYKLKGTSTKEGKDLTFSTIVKYASLQEAQNLLNEKGIQSPINVPITKVDKELKAATAPGLYSLGGVQKYANKKWKYSLDKTLEIIQSLYTKGYLTYPRTDCEHITENEFNYLLQNVTQYMAVSKLNFNVTNTAPRKKYVDNAKVVEHYAVIPTEQLPDLSKLTEQESQIYLAVVTQTLKMFAPDHTFETTTILIDIKGIEFKTTGKVVLQEGWKSLQEQTKEIEPSLPPLTEGESLLMEITIDEGTTKPPERLTEATLGAAKGLMEKLDIGRPATRGAIVKTLINREFMRVEQTKLFPTEKGKLVFSMTKDLLIGKPEMTGKWEQYLKLIGDGKGNQTVFVTKIEGFVNETLEQLKTQKIDQNNVDQVMESNKIATCPKCKKGIITEKSKLFPCSEEKCDFVLWKVVAGKTLSVAQATELLTKKKTKLIQNFKGKKGPFNAKLTLKEDFTLAFEFEDKPKATGKKFPPKRKGVTKK